MTAAEPTEPTVEPTAEPTTEPTEPQPQAGWMDQAGFSEDLKANPSLQKFKDPAALGKSYVELEKLLGSERVTVPGENASEEELGAFYEKLGRPESVEGYGLADWQPPEGLPWDGDVATKMVEKMHSLGLSTKQAQGVLNSYAEIQNEVYTQHVGDVEAKEKEVMESLRSEWGAAFEPKIDAARRAALSIANTPDGEESIFDTIILADGSQLGSHPDIIRLFAHLGESMSEDTGPGPRAARSTSTPDEAMQQLNSIYADANQMKILKDTMHPQHKALYERMTALQKQAYPDEA